MAVIEKKKPENITVKEGTPKIDGISSAKTSENLQPQKETNKDSYKLNFNYLTLCCKKGSTKEDEDFKNSCRFVNYYMDIQVYLKKMLELEVIKFCFFSKNEREAIKFIVNPDDKIDNYELIQRKINLEYNIENKNKDGTSRDDNIFKKMKEVMKNLVEDGVDRKVSKRLMKLISDVKLKFK